MLWGPFGIARISAALLAFAFGLANCVVAQPAAQKTAALPRVSVTVYPLAYAEGYLDAAGNVVAEPIGLCYESQVSVGGFAPGKIRVGVLDSSIDATGRLKRATIWQAALVASQLLDYNPQAMQVMASTEGETDGPSAGALFTVGILAAVQGHALKDDVTMTGTINPDGVIGPVGGIPQKLEGAARAGKKIVLIPNSSRFDVDMKTKESVDLIEHGKKLGLEVRLVNDVWAAYKLFTGKEIPREPRAELPALPSEATQYLKSNIEIWNSLYKQGLDAYKSRGDAGQSEYTNELIAAAAESMKSSQRLLATGQFAPAYWDALWSTALSWAASEVGRCEVAYAKGGLKGAQEAVRHADWVTNEANQAMAALQAFRPETLEQLAVYMEACNEFASGLCYQQLARNLRENFVLRVQDEQLAGEVLLTAAEQQVIAWLQFKLTWQYLKLAAQYEGTPIPTDAPVEELAELYYRSAKASMVVVDELHVKPLAKLAQKSHEEAEFLAFTLDPTFGVNHFGVQEVYPNLSQHYGTGRQLPYAKLATATALHTRAAMLIAKYYSLGVQLDENLAFVKVTNEAKFNNWLDASRDQARRAIGALVRREIDHTTCTQMYSIARIYEGRDEEDRFEALEYYFQTNVTAQILKHLAAATE